MVKIFCEGSDDKKLIMKLLEHLKSESKIIDVNNVHFQQIILSPTKNFHGKDSILSEDYFNEIILKREKLLKVKKVLFLLDCDNINKNQKCGGCENTKKCLDKIKNLIQQKYPEIKIEYFLFNDNLEKYLLNTLADDIKNCFNDFTNCIQIENNKVIYSIYKGLYPNQPFDFSHQNFDELKNKLIWLFKGE